MIASMNRRSFLCLAAVGSFAGAVATGEERRFKAGFLGLSHSHAREKLRIVRAHSAFNLVGASEPSPDIRGGYPGVEWMTEEQVIATSDVVFVESDVRDHARQALAALRAGRHIHIEKPPSVRLEDMQEMVRLARERNLLLQSGYMWRSHPGFHAIFEAVRAGWLGEVYQLRGMMNTHLAVERRPEWAEFSGGGFFELAAHLVDVVVRLMGRPARISPYLRSSIGAWCHHQRHQPTQRLRTSLLRSSRNPWQHDPQADRTTYACC
jgi:predicted dehydrogenase